ncbi:keywimysin-related RiPP [Crossiella sp. SN42]
MRGKRRAYERPTLTGAGSFTRKTGLGVTGGPEHILVLPKRP